MRKRYWVYLALLLFWTGFIFSNSLTPGSVSSAQSGRLTQIVVGALEKISIYPDPDLVTLTLRKLAHAAEFFLLGLLACGVADTSRYGLRANWSRVMLYCMTCGVTDELLQSFVVGRSSQVTDVVIDSLAGFTALLCGLLIVTVRRNKRRRK